MGGQILDARFLATDLRSVPAVRTGGGLTMSLDAALTNYEVIDATPEERRVLERWGHPFGGVQ